MIRQLLRQGLRRLLATPGFSLAAVAILATGIGMTTSAFSAANFLLLRSMPYPHGEELVRVFRANDHFANLAHSPGNYLDIRASAACFSSLSAFFVTRQNLAVPGEPPELCAGIDATANFLRTLQVQPMLGRDFDVGADRPGKGAVVILTYSFWQRKFGGDPGILGRPLRIGSSNVNVIGILPPIFDAGLVWEGAGWIAPLTLGPNLPNERGKKWFHVVGRLNPATTIVEAQTQLAAIAARLAADHPVENVSERLRVIDLCSSHLDAEARKTVWLISGLAALVLIIGCANLAALQVARAFTRIHELAVCAALGATPWQRSCPLLVESAILAAAGGTSGVLLAFWCNGIVGHAYAMDRIPLDSRVVLFAAALSAITAVLFGLTPAWLASRAATADALKESGSRGATGHGNKQLKFALVIGQIALALILLCAAATFGLATHNAFRRNLGWTPPAALNAMLILSPTKYPTDVTKLAFLRRMHERLARIPGVTDVVQSSGTPIYNFTNRGQIEVEGAPAVKRGQEPVVLLNSVDANFFSSLQIRLNAGDFFSRTVRETDPRVMIVNETLAKTYWPEGGAVGKRIRLVGDTTWAQIVGVVADVRMATNFTNPGSHLQMYRPLVQAPTEYENLLISTAGSPESLTAPVRAALAELDPDMTVLRVGPVASLMAFMLSLNDVSNFILTSFAAVGLLISLMGLYAVIAQLTLQRNREFAIRAALGAEPRQLVTDVLRHSGMLVLFGIGCGLVGAFWVNAMIRRILPESGSPPSWLQITVALGLALVGIAACWFPARRAGKVDPARALRCE